MWCWGENHRAQLGDGSTDDQNVPLQVEGLENVRYMAQGNATSSNFATTMDGETYAWGYNYYGSLGVGSGGRPRVFSAPTLLRDF
jgi:alpha-tubulin suppressor-like RCC1 family protein